MIRQLISKTDSLLFCFTAIATLILMCFTFSAQAENAGTDGDKKNYKLTVGDYFYRDPSGNFSGQDLNLRYRRNNTSAWVGFYHDRVFGEQARIGFDTSWQPLDTLSVSILPSLQAATHGFVGGNFAVQVGTIWFAQVGIGRTNLRPYANLNFDPNDALTFAIGHRSDNGSTYSLTTVADDRLHTGQRHTHLVGQWQLPYSQRLTIDILHKTGNGDDGYVRVWGETVTYDFPRWFLRVAYDPKQNFGTANATRLSVGIRF